MDTLILLKIKFDRVK